MYFFYMDGSGQTGIKSNSQDNGLYILSGIIVHEKDWQTIEKKLEKLKQDLFPTTSPDEWELHAFEIWNSKGFFDRDELNVNYAKKQEIFSKIIEFVCNSEVTLINVVIVKDQLKPKHSSMIMEHAWTFIVERFEHFLQQQPPNTNNGLIFMDSSQRIPESEIKRVLWNLVRKDSKSQNITHVVESPIFTRSHLRNLIQLADMIAYVIYRHYYKNDKRFKEWFDSLTVKMYQHDGSFHGYGIKIFPIIKDKK